MMPNCFGEFGIAFVELGAWVMNPNALLLTGFCHAPEDVSCLFSFRRECSHPPGDMGTTNFHENDL